MANDHPMAPDPLHRDAALLKALMESSMIDAIIVSDSKGIIQRINAAAMQIFGYDSGTLVGKSINTLMPPQKRADHDGFIQRYMRTGVSHIMGNGREIQGMRRDGTVFPLHVTVGHTELEGEMLFIAMMHDITDRKKAENAVTQASRMEAIGQLTGGFAHDFNNLLTIAIGNLELLQPKLRDEADLGMLRDALESVEVGAELTAHLLAFARRSILEPVQVDINDEIRRAIRLLRHSLNHGIEIVTRLAPDLEPVKVDAARLQAALLNLAVNAQDAMPDGGVLTFETASVDAQTDPVLLAKKAGSGGYVRISVQDTGSGMGPETVKQVFEPFFTTKPLGRGTGLGLAMVHGFVHQSGGHTDVTSKLGRGTTMQLYLPLSSTSVSPNDGFSAPAQAKTVLVVEDNDGLRQLTTTRIHNIGHFTYDAPDAKTALGIIESDVKIDLLFTDVVMPGDMDGRALARHVRLTRPDIKILLTTGFSEPLVRDNQTDPNPFPILQKPYHQSDLAQMLAKLLDDAPA